MNKSIFLALWLLATCSLYSQTCEDGSPATIKSITVGGMNSWDAFGDPNNEVFMLCGFAANGNMVGLSWTGVDLSPVGGSNCSEVVLQFGNTINLLPALGENSPPPCNNGYAGGSNSNLQELNLDFPADQDGCVSIEIFESLDNNSNSIDAGIDAGSITMTGCPQGLSLPIELALFEAEILDKINIIRWTTASESNSAWHILQRSADGRANWEDIGQLPAAGNSAEPKHYVLEDYSPLHFSFYRLKEIAFDGRAQYSHIISVKRPVVDFQIENLSPNPAGEILSVTIGSVDGGKVMIEIVDQTGKNVHRSSFIAEEGLAGSDLDVGPLPPGTYFLVLKKERTRQVREFTKL